MLLAIPYVIDIGTPWLRKSLQLAAGTKIEKNKITKEQRDLVKQSRDTKLFEQQQQLNALRIVNQGIHFRNDPSRNKNITEIIKPKD